jgi:hypothetical protein
VTGLAHLFCNAPAGCRLQRDASSIGTVRRPARKTCHKRGDSGLAEPGWMAAKDCGLGPSLARSLFGFSAIAMGELLRRSAGFHVEAREAAALLQAGVIRCEFNDKTRHPETDHWRPWTKESGYSSGFAGTRDHSSKCPQRCSLGFCGPRELYRLVFASCRVPC